MRSRTTKLHSAISPSMKDQWSGKTLRRLLHRRGEPEPVVGPGRRRRRPGWASGGGRGGALLSATLLGVDAHCFHAPRSSVPRVRRSRLGDQVPLVVDRQRKLRQRAGGRAEDDLGGVGEVEGRLVAGAEHVVGGRSFSEIGQPDVGADLRVADDAVDGPVSRPVDGDDLVGLHLTRMTAPLALATWSSTPSIGVEFSSVGNSASGSALTRSPISRSEARMGVPTTSRTTRSPSPEGVVEALPPRVPTWSGGPRSRRHDGGHTEQADRTEQRAADQRARRCRTPRRRVEGGEGGLAVLGGGAGGVAQLDDLVVTHELAGPLDDADADEQHRHAEAVRPSATVEAPRPAKVSKLSPMSSVK